MFNSVANFLYNLLPDLTTDFEYCQNLNRHKPGYRNNFVYIESRPRNTFTMALQIKGETTMLKVDPNSLKDDFEKVDGAQGEMIDKKEQNQPKPTEGNMIAATEGATQSKMACTSDDVVKGPEDEVLDLPSKDISGRSSHTNLNNLLAYSPKPQPPITEKQIKGIQKGRDQPNVMAEQVNKMRRGMQKLQEITQKFNCMEKYKEDVDYLVQNLAKCLTDDPKPKANEEKTQSEKAD